MKRVILVLGIYFLLFWGCSLKEMPEFKNYCDPESGTYLGYNEFSYIKIPNNYASSVAVAKNGLIYVGSGTHLYTIDQNGDVLNNCDITINFNEILVDSKNNLFLRNDDHAIVKVSNNIALKYAYFTDFKDYCIDKDDNLYIYDKYGDSLIRCLDNNLDFISFYCLSNDGHPAVGDQIVIDSSKNIYVINSTNILKFNPVGIFLYKTGINRTFEFSSGIEYAICDDQDHLFLKMEVLSPKYDRIFQHYDQTGNFVRQYGPKSWSSGMAVDQLGFLYTFNRESTDLDGNSYLVKFK